ncbi:hypothetical protein BDV37DRAFT_223833 [Aspergillus pseudonomiae]|uniref:Uncharacterized protein n=1 Tax=Aspergillus pseudonomiae TaxID=1506151 RepID=A0A5N7DPC9_9EURO|nr:uncharacterized protein BDV37DRAFT_223833 [Aspergillus pseudonomiae]KAE8407869.1 hypothetical protein BDV37DRAFT_223833 [Aspergillus pseudonomiae]
METRLKHLSQKFSALDDVGIMDDESDWDGEYFPSGYRSEDLYGNLSLDVNMVDSSVLLETSSCVSMSTEENEEVSDISNDDMDKVDKSFIEKLEVRALMALPIHDFIKMKPIQSIIDSLTQPQLVDMARKLLELDKF